MPHECSCAPARRARPARRWADGAAYDASARKLAGMFRDNFEQYAADVSPEVLAAGPDPDAIL